MATQTSRRLAQESLLFLVIAGASLVVLNVLGNFVSGRVDLTERELFSLSKGSSDLAKSLTDRLDITAYFTEDLPPPFNATERYVRDTLVEYAQASEGKINVAFVNPDDEESMEAAQQDGIQRVAHQVVENDAVSVREGYRGIVLKYLGEKKTIPVIQDTTGLEYRITLAIKQLIGDQKKVALVKDVGGPTLEKGMSKLGKLLPTYKFEEIDAKSTISDEYAAVIVVGAKETLSDEVLRNIDAYLMQGGSVGIFGGTVSPSFESAEPTASIHNTGVNTLLKPYDVTIQDDLVMDWQCGRAPMAGPLGMRVAVPYPPVPIAILDEAQQQHPAMFRLASAPLPFASQLKVGDGFADSADVKVRVLAASSENSWSLEGPSFSLRPRRPQEWTMGENRGPFTLAVAMEGKLPSAFAPEAVSSPENGDAPPSGLSKSAKDARLIVTGSSTFLRDELLPDPAQQQQARETSSATALAMNVIDWLAQDADLIGVRAKTVEDPALAVPAGVEQAETAARAAAETGDAEGMQAQLAERKNALAAWETKKAGYRWFNMLGLPLAFALYGLWRYRRRRTLARELARPVGA